MSFVRLLFCVLVVYYVCVVWVCCLSMVHCAQRPFLKKYFAKLKVHPTTMWKEKKKNHFQVVDHRMLRLGVIN